MFSLCSHFRCWAYVKLLLLNGHGAMTGLHVTLLSHFHASSVRYSTASDALLYIHRGLLISIVLLLINVCIQVTLQNSHSCDFFSHIWGSGFTSKIATVRDSVSRTTILNVWCLIPIHYSRLSSYTYSPIWSQLSCKLVQFQEMFLANQMKEMQAIGDKLPLKFNGILFVKCCSEEVRFLYMCMCVGFLNYWPWNIFTSHNC